MSSLNSFRSFLSAVLLGLAGAVSATPVTYMYIGTITDSSYSGVNAGDPITITVTYDPTTGPANFINFSNGSTEAYLEDDNGTAYGQPWATWMNVTASFDSYTWQNDMTSGYVNDGERVIFDNLPGKGGYEDFYQPFGVEQYICSDANCSKGSSTIVQERFGYWLIDTTGASPPTLTNGLGFPQPIDLSKGNQSGQLYSVDPGTGASFVDFQLNQIDVQAPEPATLALLGIGLAGLGFSRRRKLN